MKWVKAIDQKPPVNVPVLIKTPTGVYWDKTVVGWENSEIVRKGYEWLDESPDPELMQLRRIKEEYLSVAPRLEKFAELKGHWSTILFIPQDLGFEHQTHKPKGHHTMDVFHKDGFATTKGSDGLWIVQHGKNIMKFKINSKFEAFVIFNALGLKLDQRTDFELVVNDEEE